MSSTSTYFQDPAHIAACLYTHPEMEPQQPYSSNGFMSYLMDSEFPEDEDAYSAYSESRYDEAQYNYSPPGSGPSKYEDHHLGFRYGRTMQYEDLTSPQLLCPQPTLPLSQFPRQFSWSDRQSEAPMNVYQAYSEPQRHANSIPHSPQAGEIQYSFENHRTLMSTPEFYPATQEFAETAPHSISTPHHGGGLVGYSQQSFLASTAFEQVPTRSDYSTNNQPTYNYTAHQPIPPEKRSSYSELAPNLSYMNSQPPLLPQESIHVQDRCVPKVTHDDPIARTGTTPSRDIKKNPYALGLDGPPLTSIGRKVPPPPPVPSDHAVVDTTAAPVTTKTKSSRSVNEPRRPSLACTFCRERKIACGRPPDGSADLTCNQCARRSFRCRYLDTKLSQGRSRAGSKDPSSPLNSKCK